MGQLQFHREDHNHNPSPVSAASQLRIADSVATNSQADGLRAPAQNVRFWRTLARCTLIAA